MTPSNTARTRTIDIRYKWITEQVTRGVVRIEHISGMEMPENGLTKALAKEKHGNFDRMLGIAMANNTVDKSIQQYVLAKT